jgi:uncharacterized protein YgfB (UPF0149 family)
MKQTAVEWLAEQLNRNGLGLTIEEIKQAKEMEKEQIIDACNIDKRQYDNAEQYYNETFKSE